MKRINDDDLVEITGGTDTIEQNPPNNDDPGVAPTVTGNEVPGRESKDGPIPFLPK